MDHILPRGRDVAETRWLRAGWHSGAAQWLPLRRPAGVSRGTSRNLAAAPPATRTEPIAQRTAERKGVGGRGRPFRLPACWRNASCSKGPLLLHRPLRPTILATPGRACPTARANVPTGSPTRRGPPVTARSVSQCSHLQPLSGFVRRLPRTVPESDVLAD